MNRMTDEDYKDIDAAMEAVFDTAMEVSHVIDPKTRDSLPDKAFGIVYKDDKGVTQRKYPLVVKNDPEATKELVSKAISFFHYCKHEWKADLAKKIIQVIKEQKLKVTINKKSQILKYVNERNLPPTVKLVETKKK